MIDDLVAYRRDWDHFVIVANASNKDTVFAELRGSRRRVRR